MPLYFSNPLVSVHPMLSGFQIFCVVFLSLLVSRLSSMTQEKKVKEPEDARRRFRYDRQREQEALGVPRRGEGRGGEGAAA